LIGRIPAGSWFRVQKVQGSWFKVQKVQEVQEVQEVQAKSNGLLL
jgi:hypothetical protein